MNFTKNKQTDIDNYFKNRHPNVYSKSQEDNIKVWKNTQYLFTQGKFKHFIPNPSIVYPVEWNIDLNKYQKCCENTKVKVWNNDTLESAKCMINEGHKPLVLNLASNIVCGGGVRKGSRAQEECLFRRSNYFLTLDKQKLPKSTYPLIGNTAVYSKNVYIVKNMDYSLIEDEKDRYFVDFVAVAGLRRPTLTKDKQHLKFEADKLDLINRIERIYQVGIHQGYKCMLLGALGCGAFKNPAQEVVNIFKNMNDKYNGYFERIDFAILSEDGNLNYKIFKHNL